MPIETLLSRPVATIPPTATCVEAARRMRRQNIGSLVIEQDGAPVGIVTDRDLAVRVMADEIDPASITVGSIMSKFPAFLGSSRDLGEAVRVMREMGVRRLPALDSRGRMIGMLSLDDVLMALSDQFAEIRALLQGESNPGPTVDDGENRGADAGARTLLV